MNCTENPTEDAVRTFAAIKSIKVAASADAMLVYFSYLRVFYWLEKVA
jgi:hypothetical protein